MSKIPKHLEDGYIPWFDRVVLWWRWRKAFRQVTQIRYLQELDTYVVYTRKPLKGEQPGDFYTDTF